MGCFFDDAVNRVKSASWKDFEFGTRRIKSEMPL